MMDSRLLNVLQAKEGFCFEKYQMIYVFNTPYVYHSEDKRGLFLLDQRKDYDSFLYLPVELWNFISLRKNVAEIVMKMDDVEKGSYQYLMMQNYELWKIL